MIQHIVMFLVVAVVFITIAVVIIRWYNYRLKKRIIDSGPIDEGALNFLRKLMDMGAEQLKWGYVFFLSACTLVDPFCQKNYIKTKTNMKNIFILLSIAIFIFCRDAAAQNTQ